MTPFNNGYISVAIAAVFWGTIGLFVKILGGMGLSIEAIVFIRLFYGCLILALIMYMKSGSYFKVDLKGLALLAFMGVFTQAAFNLVYFKTIEVIGVASAAVLVYVAPVLITLLSRLIFKEVLNPFKKIGLVICLLGAFMAITGGRMETLNMDQKGILLGLLSAVIYAMLSITSKIAIERYDPLTVVFYSFLFGTMAISPFVPHEDFMMMFSKLDMIMLSFTMGLVPAAFAYFSYFRGIGQKIDLSIVGIISTLELLVSVLIGRLFLNESITALKMVGLSLIMLSIFISQYQGHKVNKKLV
ncbi:DMT family transporter [Fusibacter ferrireducens]|uniref:EamA family transporter n=1 Tax=Fusibacter ferrireducens TaxID=2785058 RepID=A0ABR9ZN67_9FIRM|nr:DMT family transporter [Fusibacter ferrireducens]MBF4691917.1 EamA family transporter [Fusibacter ferrireducens]